MRRSGEKKGSPSPPRGGGAKRRLEQFELQRGLRPTDGECEVESTVEEDGKLDHGDDPATENDVDFETERDDGN